MGIYLCLCRGTVGRLQTLDLRGGDRAGGTTHPERSGMKYEKHEWLMELIGIALIAMVVIVWA